MLKSKTLEKIVAFFRKLFGMDIDIFEKIISLENLFAAYREFVHGKRKRPDVIAFSYCLEDNLFSLHKALISGQWQHGGYETFTVCDPKPRTIHKADVADRILHHAVTRVLEPIFEPSFIFDSWSCRVGKGNIGAVLRAESFYRRLSVKTRGPVWALKLDIKKYFASVDQNILLRLIDKKNFDERTIYLIKNIIGSFSKGLPLGNLTSQLFANIYLNPLDHFIKEKLRASFYLRYCDDLLFLDFNRERLVESIDLIKKFLLFELNLMLSPQKIFLRPFHRGVDWLGFVLFPTHRILRPKTRKRSLSRCFALVNEYLDGCISAEYLQTSLISTYGMLCLGKYGEDRKFLACLMKCL